MLFIYMFLPKDKHVYLSAVAAFLTNQMAYVATLSFIQYIFVLGIFPFLTKYHFDDRYKLILLFIYSYSVD